MINIKLYIKLISKEKKHVTFHVLYATVQIQSIVFQNTHGTCKLVVHCMKRSDQKALNKPNDKELSVNG